ncbi:OPT family oligopeptide transporter [Corynebacterium pyruviciproducens ATCC BAA-1742]|uniref:OPT family oligopeptide transporter n=1 Tax=Corynebacterium pyruviciproducens ATCC BAA-1742 TaxID=1125779 RepID=S2ZCN5_9CORY|nr:oligopeptide transporter, OPT family [Corynebacterium pyruviciproducens]EPD67692.1 OPT family oligopeptide transporter [Corynebacterium pyruviciproducens ATCC BAA-1742]
MTTKTPTTGERSADSPIKELTIRAVIIGGLITLVFTAANVYLGLKVGLTFATSIPAAVISMAILRRFADHTVQENNIVQTIASAAGTLSAIIFVLPGLVMIGWWTGFSYWETACVVAVGGILGVTYSIPLRRALVTGSDLPYPEGVAAAEVLKVGDTHGSVEENKRGLKVIIVGGLVSAGMSLLTAMKLAAGSLKSAFHVGSGGSMFGFSISMALVGVGHLVGVGVSVAMLVGVAISHGVLLPVISSGLEPEEGDTFAKFVQSTFNGDVRMAGAGAMTVAALWTLLKIIGPIVRGIKESLASSRHRKAGDVLPLTERDMPMSVVVTVTLASMLPIGALLWLFVKDTDISHHVGSLIAVSIIFTLLIGLVVAGICGYMAGLIGASNSPISGVGVIIVITAALLIKVVATGDASQTDDLVAYTLFTASIVFGIATISNDNLQDLKTGQLVGATPWRQQVALIIGVIFGAAVIPPVLQLMLTGFGFAGMEGAGPDALAAPQAALMTSLATGIFGGSLDWGLIGTGALIGCAIVAFDELLGRSTKNKYHLPPLAVGMGMYLPITVTCTVPIGAFIGYFYDKFAEKHGDAAAQMKRLGVLMATGLIVGESLFGVLNAGIIAGSGVASPLQVVPDSFETAANWIGLVVFIGLLYGSYKWVFNLSKNAKQAIADKPE